MESNDLKVCFTGLHKDENLTAREGEQLAMAEYVLGRVLVHLPLRFIATELDRLMRLMTLSLHSSQQEEGVIASSVDMIQRVIHDATASSAVRIADDRPLNSSYVALLQALRHPNARQGTWACAPFLTPMLLQFYAASAAAIGAALKPVYRQRLSELRDRPRLYIIHHKLEVMIPKHT